MPFVAPTPEHMREVARRVLQAAYPDVRVYRMELAQRIAHAEAAAAARKLRVTVEKAEG